MCGIVGYVGPQEAATVILHGLQRLEYRGYDSAGIAVVNGGNAIVARRAVGKLQNLTERLQSEPLPGHIG
ncbi:MAG TPA: glutamine--fructose-6-phosphate aminotransferase, partial [Chloroflexi bacterium]|nr:glutamine--fructose-6-phosphate aminotransferase [Chloroflexota bacterium]